MSAGRVVVVGGGLSGLVVAHALGRRGRDVVLLEAGADPGGVVRTLRKGEFLLELGPNTVRPAPAVVQLVRELGLEPRMRLSPPGLPRFVQIGGRLRKIPFPALSLPGAVRALADLWIPRRRGGEPEESVSEFFARRFGAAVAQNLAEPFVSGIFAGDAQRLSISAAFPKMAEAESHRGSVIRGFASGARSGPKPAPRVRGLLSFDRGLGVLPEALAAGLGERFRPGARVERIDRGGAGWTAATARGSHEAEVLILAGNSAEAARLCRPFAPEAARALEEIPSPPLCVVHASWGPGELERPLAGFGHLLRPRDGRRLLGAVWSSGIFPDRAPEGFALATFFLGGRRAPENAAIAESDLAGVLFEETRRALGARVPPEIVHVERYAHSIPQYERGHAARIGVLEAAERSHDGLYFLGNYRGGISVGDVTENAANLATRV